jgi:NAD(P)-dependent dehydrogenase (short-subunit alcohol dehydrogenase family)
VDYTGKVAIVTGAASGIGLGITQQCAQEGMRIMLADLDLPGLEREGKGLAASGAQVSWCRTDVTSENDWTELIEKTLQQYGQIDCLFSNAGISFNKTLATTTEAEWKWIFDVNFWSHVKAFKAILPTMLAQETGGHITITASFAAFVAPATMVPYACTKSAVLSLAEGMRHELDMTGQGKIKLSVVMPAYVVSNIQHNEAARPTDCRKLEATSNEIDRAVWAKITEDIKAPNIYNGAISGEVAGERILDQMKRGCFYIYTHRNFVKALAYEKTGRMLQDKPPVEPGSFMAEHYARKFND